MKLPTITLEVCQVSAVRGVEYVEGVGFDAKYAAGDATYTAHTVGGDQIDITKSEFEWLSAALAGDR